MTTIHLAKKMRELFAAYSREASQANLQPYFNAVSTVHVDDAINAIDDFLMGRVPTHDKRFMPASPQLAERAAVYDDYRRKRQNRCKADAEQKKFLAAPRVDPKRRAEIVEKTMAKHNAWREDQERQNPELSTKGKFEPITAQTLKDPRPISERLKISKLDFAHYATPETKPAKQAKNVGDLAKSAANNLKNANQTAE